MGPRRPPRIIITTIIERSFIMLDVIIAFATGAFELIAYGDYTSLLAGIGIDEDHALVDLILTSTGR